jgi:hypothetical protein
MLPPFSIPHSSFSISPTNHFSMIDAIMSLKKILVCLDADPQPSVFDGVVAVDAGVDFLFRHAGVTPGQVRDLVYGAMFTRGPQELKHTAVFIGGSDVTAAEALLKAATEAFFGPMRVSVMLDANGANTTAAAAVLAARRHVPLRGAIVTVLAGTGAVGRRVVRLLAKEGARVRVASRKQTHAEGTCDKISRIVPGADLTAWTNENAMAAATAVEGAQAVIACGPPGVELLPKGYLGQAAGLRRRGADRQGDASRRYHLLRRARSWRDEDEDSQSGDREAVHAQRPGAGCG